MLRRIADNLFWAARYLERASFRARLVSVNYQLLVEKASSADDPWGPLLAITGEAELFDEHYPEADEESVLRFFTFDETNPASIRSCIRAARSNGSALRHRISSELWLELNGLYLDTQEWNPEAMRRTGVFEFYTDLRDRFYRLAGIVDETLPRDLAFDFFELGRLVERADDVARLLDAKYHILLPRAEDVGGALDVQQWAALLRSASALEAYRRANGNAIRVDRVVDLLLFDRTFPRSARFCVDRMASALARIQDDGCAGPEGIPLPTDGLDALLRTAAADEVIEQGLHDYVLLVQDECARIGAAIDEQFLRFE